jgi:acetyl esterase/lipase
MINLIIKKVTLSIILLVLGVTAFSQIRGYLQELNIPYYNETMRKSDNYINEKCVLDIYYPEKRKDFPTIVWFHGGGLTAGDKAQSFPWRLVQNGVAVVSVNYRLYPKVKCPKYLEDAAAAVAWVFAHIKSYGGNPRLVFVAGHSAGAYLTNMLGLDKKWLAAYHIDADSIAGLFSVSGNGITHQAIRDERGISNSVPVVDEYAPLFHVRADAPPLFLMTGDREMEYIGRYEENAYFYRMMKLVGHKKTTLYEFDGYGHDITIPAFPLMLRQVSLISEQVKNIQK